ncbi:MAG: hypothetical protein RL745_345 [Actinomycetota bacterium]
MAFDALALREQLLGCADDVVASAQSFLAGNTAPGISYGVVHGGELLFAGGAGMATLGGTAPSAESIFRIASMTKSFTAAAILQLRDAGLINLEAPMSDYVPELATLALPTPDSRMPTVRDLLTMQGGWATDDPWADRQESMAPADYTRQLSDGFVFNDQPGTQFEYSNLGYTILGRIITNVSGMQYQDFVSRRLLQPLGLVNTGFALADVDASLLANGHFRRDDAWHVEPVAPTGEFAPLGGLFSNVVDLSRWVTFMCDASASVGPADQGDSRSEWDAVLGRDSRRQMQQGHRHIFASVSVDPATASVPVALNAPMYGFGLMNSPHARFGSTVGHSGGYPGYGTHMVWHPATGVGVIALSNGRYGGAFRLATQVLRDLLVKVDAPSRVIVPTPSTKKSFIAVNRLLVEWDDAAADALFGPNMDEDELRAHRVAGIKTAIDTIGGIAGPAEEISSTASSHMVWWLPGTSGRLRVEVRLNPLRQQQLQTLNVRAVAGPSQELVTLAVRVAKKLHTSGQLPEDIARAADVDSESLVRVAGIMRALEASIDVIELPVAAESSTSATFRIRGATMKYDLSLALNEQGEIAKATLAVIPQSSDDNALLRL